MIRRYVAPVTVTAMLMFFGAASASADCATDIAALEVQLSDPPIEAAPIDVALAGILVADATADCEGGDEAASQSLISRVRSLLGL